MNSKGENMTWQHKPGKSPDLTREELDRVVSLCGSDPSLESIRRKVEECLSVYLELDNMLDQARIKDEERRLEKARLEKQFQNEAVWHIFQYAASEE